MSDRVTVESRMTGVCCLLVKGQCSACFRLDHERQNCPFLLAQKSGKSVEESQQIIQSEAVHTQRSKAWIGRHKAKGMSMDEITETQKLRDPMYGRGKTAEQKWKERQEDKCSKTGLSRVPCYLHTSAANAVPGRLILETTLDGSEELCCHPGTRCQYEYDGRQGVARTPEEKQYIVDRQDWFKRQQKWYPDWLKWSASQREREYNKYQGHSSSSRAERGPYGKGQSGKGSQDYWQSRNYWSGT